MEKQKTTENIELLRIISGGSPSNSNSVNKFGYNGDIDLATSEDIWTFGGLYPFSTFVTAKTLEVVSSSAQDAVGGTGAITMLIEGLGDALEEKTETITLTGATPVSLTGNWLAVNRMYILTTGSGGVNAGTINCQVTGAGQVVSQIAFRLALTSVTTGKGQTEQAVYRIPAGKIGQVKELHATVEVSAATQVNIELIQVLNDCQTIRTKGSYYVTEVTPLDRSYNPGGPTFAAGEWVVMRVVETSSNNTKCSGEFDLLLEDI